MYIYIYINIHMRGYVLKTLWTEHPAFAAHVLACWCALLKEVQDEQQTLTRSFEQKVSTVSIIDSALVTHYICPSV